MITKSYVDLIVFLLLKYNNFSENNSGKKIVKNEFLVVVMFLSVWHNVAMGYIQSIWKAIVQYSLVVHKTTWGMIQHFV